MPTDEELGSGIEETKREKEGSFPLPNILATYVTELRKLRAVQLFHLWCQLWILQSLRGLLRNAH